MTRPLTFTALAIALYVVLAYIYALVKPIWCDEVWAMIPSANLAFHGFMGMGVQALTPNQQFGYGCSEQYVYWFPPLSFVSMGAWFKVAGYNLLMARWHTILWGVVLLAGVYWIGRRWNHLSHIPHFLQQSSPSFPTFAWTGAWAVLICALDYNFLNCSTARQDIMCAALGIWAIGTRSAWLSAAACMVHPFGLIYAVLLACLKRKVDWMPYIVAFGGWGYYIAQAPDVFIQQFVGQIVHHADIINGLGVYLAFGTGWRLVLLAVYVGCAAVVARQNRDMALCLAFVVLPAFFLTYSSAYMAHAVPWLALCVAIQMRRYPWLGAIVLLELIFAVTTLIPLWTWDGRASLGVFEL